MKKTYLLLFFALSLGICSAQNKTNIEFTSSNELLVNGQSIDNETSLQTMIGLLGEPTLIKEYKTGKRNYTYPEYGLAIQTYDNKLLMVGVNLNWDGDKNFPEKTFDGLLKINDKTIEATIEASFLAELKPLTFDNLMMELYAAKTANCVIMIAFKDKKATQIAFNFKPQE